MVLHDLGNTAELTKSTCDPQDEGVETFLWKELQRSGGIGVKFKEGYEHARTPSPCTHIRGRPWNGQHWALACVCQEE